MISRGTWAFILLDWENKSLPVKMCDIKDTNRSQFPQSETGHQMVHCFAAFSRMKTVQVSSFIHFFGALLDPYFSLRWLSSNYLLSTNCMLIDRTHRTGHVSQLGRGRLCLIRTTGIGAPARLGEGSPKQITLILKQKEITDGCRRFWTERLRSAAGLLPCSSSYRGTR